MPVTKIVEKRVSFHASKHIRIFARLVNLHHILCILVDDVH